ncbi:serine/threonine-protein kinase [Catellatospora coxensis]
MTTCSRGSGRPSTRSWWRSTGSRPAAAVGSSRLGSAADGRSGRTQCRVVRRFSLCDRGGGVSGRGAIVGGRPERRGARQVMHSPGALLGGRYRLEGRIGAGGMGEVWRATDTVLGRVVAVKTVLPALLDDPGFVRRFLAEARAMAGVRHRGVVTIHDYHGDGGGAYLVMEYVEGEPLSQTLARQGRLTVEATLAVVAQIAEALQAVHDGRIVHRDVKPGNLLVCRDGTVVLTDFGIARAQDHTALTTPGGILGTPSYLAPEQVLGPPTRVATSTRWVWWPTSAWRDAARSPARIRSRWPCSGWRSRRLRWDPMFPRPWPPWSSGHSRSIPSSAGRRLPRWPRPPAACWAARRPRWRHRPGVHTRAPASVRAAPAGLPRSGGSRCSPRRRSRWSCSWAAGWPAGRCGGTRVPGGRRRTGPSPISGCPPGMWRAARPPARPRPSAGAA